MRTASATLPAPAAGVGRRLLHGLLHTLAVALVMGCAIVTPPAQSSPEPYGNGNGGQGGHAGNGVTPPGRVGKLGFLSGPVTLSDLQTREQQAATLNWPITSGYRLTTGPVGRAEIRIGSLTLRADGDTEIDFNRIDDDLIQIVVQSGSLALRARNREILPEIDIVTPRERIVLDDVGRYRIDVDPAAGVTAVTTWVGDARVATGRSTFAVRSGQRGEFGNAPPPGFVLVQPAADTFDDWVASRDRRDDTLASTRYVSPETTGVEVLDQYGTWRTVPEYGTVWYPAAVPSGWAPYRFGRWVYVSPWGWTWIDDAPWGFAPFHYGRWALVGSGWAWVPGAWVARPIYAPALVGWYGAPGASVTVGFGSVGWFPLAPYEPYIPSYYYNRRYITGVNIGHVGNIDYRRIAPPPSYRHQRPNTSTWVPNDAIIRSEPIKRVVLAPPADTHQFVGRPTPPPALNEAGKRRAVNVAPAAPAPVPGGDVVRPAPRAGSIEAPAGGAQPGGQPAPGRKVESPDWLPQAGAPVAPAPSAGRGTPPPGRSTEFVTRPQPLPPPAAKPAPSDIDSAPVRKPMVPPPSTAPRPSPMPTPARIEPAPKFEHVAPPPRAAVPNAGPPPMRGPQSDFVVRPPAQPKVEVPRAEPPRVEPPRGEPPRAEPPRVEPPRAEPPRGGKVQREP
ncbi:MAG: hypothetical protein MUC86_07345 [Burkholderiaceae bacterium]|jgi:hypothetical protein|nr:hypothetical protein [Burkholderiaceae bacterium]